MDATAASERLVGRESELAGIEAFLERAGPAALALEGEPGIGKTTLWRAGVDAARERGQRVLVARPVEAERELSFSALGDLLAPELERLEALSPPRRRALEVALLLVADEQAAPDARAVGLATLDLLRLLADEQPLLVAIDDTQWLDPPSRETLAYAMRRLDQEPVALLVAHRPGATELVLGRSERVVVGPLSLGALHELLRKRVSARLTRPTRVRIHETSGGNPFFALELARALEGRELRPGEPLPVPASLGELTALRFERLGAETREVLLLVTALAHPTVEVVREAAGEQAGAALEAAAAVRVIENDGGRLRFTHPLLASVNYGSASSDERARVHRRLAEVVTDTEERARHLALAVEAPDAAVAAALEKAAQRAFARGAIESAAALAEQALRFTPEAQPDALHRRRLAAAGYLARAGARARARELLDVARAAAPPGTERAELALGLAWWGLGDNPTRIAALEEAVQDARGDASLLAQVHAVLGAILVPDIDVAAARPHAVVALELAERVGDPAILVLALMLAERIDFYAGRGVDVERVERALALDAVGANPWGDISVVRWFRGHQCLATGELDAARSTFEALAAEGQSRGDLGHADVLLGLAVVEARAGNWQRAQQLADEAVEIARDVDVVAEAWCHWPLTLVSALRGDVVTARAVGARGLRLAERDGSLLVRAQISAALGLLELSLGDGETAHSHLEKTARLVAGMRLGEPGVVPFVPDLVETLVAIGEVEAAEAATAELEEQGRRLARKVALACAARCRGLLAAARGDLAGALETLEDAREQAALVGQPFELGRTLLALGTVQRRAQRKRAARETLTEAQIVFDRLGALVYAERARSELAHIGGRAAAAGDELSETERRIADLVAQGRSNKEVAAALSLSPKTVEWNLSKVYAKLGVRSRAELASRRP
jgi:DNA-binding CsgD family transcriptional regulator